MEDAESYVPKLNDPVLMEGETGRLLVVGVDLSKKIARVRTTEGPVILYTVPWSKLSYFG
jgi:hypothetical protein